MAVTDPTCNQEHSVSINYFELGSFSLPFLLGFFCVCVGGGEESTLRVELVNSDLKKATVVARVKRYHTPTR